MGAVAITGALLLALGGAIAAGRLKAGLTIEAFGVAILGVAGATALFADHTYGAQWRDGVDPALGLDALSGFFLTLIAITAVPTLVYAREYLKTPAIGTLAAVFLLSLTGLLAARDVTTFLAFWELMTLAPAAAILTYKRDPEVRNAVQAYVAITHLGGAGVWIAMLALAAPVNASHALIATAALIGFGTKAGLVPLHSWLPRAHPVAPAPFSALMSGLMVKVAIYGLIRTELEWAGPPPHWLGYVLVGAGVVAALGGVLWALIQRDLKRLLAYSTIENVGVIVTALGASVLIDDPLWSALAFGAALLHAANHAVFKVLLFLGAGAIEKATGSLDLDRLGGILRAMPVTGAAFAVGCASIAGVPPLNGFASEWLTLQSLTHLALDGPPGTGLAGAAALAGIAATAALALLCFATVAGLVLLGPNRGHDAREAPLPMRAALLTLAAICVALGIVPGLLTPTLAGLAPGAPRDIATTGSGGFPALGIIVALVVLTALLSKLRGRSARTAPSWACGQPVTPALLWTSAAFTKPLRLMAESLLRPRRSLQVETSKGVVQSIRYRRQLSSPAQKLLYQPAIKTALTGAAFARKLQTGNVRTYAGYLLGLVLVLLVLVRTGALG